MRHSRPACVAGCGVCRGSREAARTRSKCRAIKELSSVEGPNGVENVLKSVETGPMADSGERRPDGIFPPAGFLRAGPAEEEGRVSCEVKIPAPLRPFCGGEKSVYLEGDSVRSLLQGLGRRHEGLLDRILGSDGELRSFVNVYVNDRDIRALNGLDTSTVDGDEIFLVPAIAGG